MQNKLIAAAALATSATALKLENTATTTLAARVGQSGYNKCHGVYAYQCIEEKVKNEILSIDAPEASFH